MQTEAGDHSSHPVFGRARGHDGHGLGKAAAQVAHASMKVFFDRKTVGAKGVYTRHFPSSATSADSFIEHPPNTLTVPLTSAMAEWVDGTFTKVVLGVESEEDLLRVYELAQEAKIPCAIIQDVGATEFKGVPTYTTVAVGPAHADQVDAITGPEGPMKGKLRLL